MPQEPKRQSLMKILRYKKQKGLEKFTIIVGSYRIIYKIIEMAYLKKVLNWAIQLNSVCKY